jgi:hypothetical protein
MLILGTKDTEVVKLETSDGDIWLKIEPTSRTSANLFLDMPDKVLAFREKFIEPESIPEKFRNWSRKLRGGGEVRTVRKAVINHDEG